MNLAADLDKRPTLPNTADAESLEPIIKRWWMRDPLKRPSFDHIVSELQRCLRVIRSANVDPPPTPTAYERSCTFVSPALRPREIPNIHQARSAVVAETTTWTVNNEGDNLSTTYDSAFTHVFSSSSSSADRNATAAC